MDGRKYVGHQVFRASGRPAEPHQRTLHLVVVAFAARPGQAGLLSGQYVRRDAQDRRARGIFRLEPVYTDHHLFTGLHALGFAIGRFRNLSLNETGLQRPQHAADVFDLADEHLRPPFDLGGQRLDVVRARQRINRVRRTALRRDDLLGAQRQQGRFVCWQCQGLILRVGVQRLRAAEDGRQGLESHPHHVVDRLLRRERRARSLGMESQHPRPRIGGAKALAHDPGPQPSGGAELRHFLQQIHLRRKEKRHPRGKTVDAQTRRDGRPQVRDPVGQCERHLLHRGGPGLTDVVAADRDGVPLREVVRAVDKHVCNQAQGGLRWEDVRPAGNVLLEDVVLGRPVEHCSGHALPLGHGNVHRQQDRRRGVDGHGGRHPVERNAVQQHLHVQKRVDGHPDPADLWLRHRMIGVVPHLRRQIKGDREPGLPLAEQVPEAAVRLFRGAEACVLPHRPQPASIHRRIDTAGERKFAGKAEVAQVVHGAIGRRVHLADLDAVRGLYFGGFLVRIH